MNDVQPQQALSPAGRVKLWSLFRRRISSALASNVVGALALLGAIGIAIATGIGGVGRGEGAGMSGMDMAYLYGAGRCWIQGLDPYDPATLEQSGGAFLDAKYFFYPPQVGILAVPLSLFSFQQALIVMWIINLGSAACLAWLCVLAVKGDSGPSLPEPAPQPQWIIPAMILASPFVSHILYMGQTSLVAAAALTGGWILARRGHWLPGGALIGIATLKPQLAFLPIFWLILERQWKTLAAGAAAAFVAGIPAIRVSGLFGSYREWFGTLSRVSECPDSVPGSPHLFSLHNVLVSMGIHLPTFIPLALLATIVLWWYRSRLTAADILPLLLCASMMFGFSADYDLVVLAPAIPSFWRHLRGRDEAAMAAGLLVVALYLPQRLFRNPELPMLQHYRVPLVLLLAVWLLMLSLQKKRKESGATTGFGPLQAPSAPCS